MGLEAGVTMMRVPTVWGAPRIGSVNEPGNVVPTGCAEKNWVTQAIWEEHKKYIIHAGSLVGRGVGAGVGAEVGAGVGAGVVGAAVPDEVEVVATVAPMLRAEVRDVVDVSKDVVDDTAAVVDDNEVVEVAEVDVSAVVALADVDVEVADVDVEAAEVDVEVAEVDVEVADVEVEAADVEVADVELILIYRNKKKLSVSS